MGFASSLAQAPKVERAFVAGFALAETLVEAGVTAFDVASIAEIELVRSVSADARLATLARERERHAKGARQTAEMLADIRALAPWPLAVGSGAATRTAPMA